MAIGQDNDGGIGQADAVVLVAIHDLPSLAQVIDRERLELVCASCDLIDERHLRTFAHARGEEVVQFGEYEW